jgi:hypothetical protein
MADEDCYELALDGEPSGLVELPVEWVRDDAVRAKGSVGFATHAEVARWVSAAD